MSNSIFVLIEYALWITHTPITTLVHLCFLYYMVSQSPTPLLNTLSLSLYYSIHNSKRVQFFFFIFIQRELLCHVLRLDEREREARRCSLFECQEELCLTKTITTHFVCVLSLLFFDFTQIVMITHSLSLHMFKFSTESIFFFFFFLLDVITFSVVFFYQDLPTHYVIDYTT